MLFLIDASVYVFRAYYSMPPDMADADGNPTHAAFGLARFLGDLIERVKPEYLAVAFDESLGLRPRQGRLQIRRVHRFPTFVSSGCPAARLRG